MRVYIEGEGGYNPATCYLALGLEISLLRLKKNYSHAGSWLAGGGPVSLNLCHECLYLDSSLSGSCWRERTRVCSCPSRSPSILLHLPSPASSLHT